METEELLDYQKPALGNMMFRNVLLGDSASTCIMHASEQSGSGTEFPTDPDDPEL
jgi:hypothetical protein